MKRYVFRLTLILLITLQASFGFFKTLGFDIVDSEGNPFILKGYGLGGWLVPEGYMLHTPGYGSPTSIRNQIVDVIGENETEKFFELYRKNYVNEADIELIAEWGFNSIRLPFHYEFFSPINSPGVYIEDGFDIIDTLLIWCKRNNLYLILDMHCAPGGQNSGNISDSDGEAKLWTVLANQDRTVEIWKRIAERYVDEEWIVGYDLLNEPVLPDGYSTSDFRAFFVRLATAVREVDTNHTLLIEGNWYATDFSGLTPSFDSNMAWAFHKYWSETDLSSIQQYRNLRTQTVAPLWLGETGENSNPWFYETVKLMDQQNIGWNWWAHKKFDTVTSPLSAVISAGYQQILDYWNGNAAKPSVSFAVSVLTEMANSLKLENCVYRSDVIAAITDPEFGTISKPFTLNMIPGTINAVNYDFGTNGVAYYDTEYKKVRWDADQPWNLGYAYRNDGVDIEENSGVYNIGWIENGEWVNYTAEIVYGGKYNISFQIASTSNNGKVQVLLDDQTIIDSIDIPNTGGWQNWQTITVESVDLPKGNHTIKLNYLKGGFNFRKMSFTLVDNSIIEEVTSYLYIGKNYPNPFNDRTIIPIILTQPTNIQLLVFDLKGTKIAELVSGVLPVGLTEIIWDGTDTRKKRVSAGVYFYQLNLNSAKQTAKPMLYLK
ncbi:cellulase family glycosylhydrolase [bacterium]|nr:cellulase family glycosylhydrolase [bacterium]MBU1636014.1 cellulase family glycosylhydrolase [bacterium]